MGLNFKNLFVMAVMNCLNIWDFTIITVKVIDYHCIIHDISNSDAIILLVNLVLDNCGYI